MATSLLIVVLVVAMIASLGLIFIPAVPVSVLEWAFAIVFGIVTNFMRLTPAAALICTIFMLLGTTSGLWMPLLGMRGREVSCLGIVAFFGGMLVGSFVIPIPFIGTFIGGTAAVIIVEFARVRDFFHAVRSGTTALKTVLLSMVAELFFAAAIIATTLISIMLTG